MWFCLGQGILYSAVVPLVCEINDKPFVNIYKRTVDLKKIGVYILSLYSFLYVAHNEMKYNLELLQKESCSFTWILNMFIIPVGYYRL